jgi:hypothetical protein
MGPPAAVFALLVLLVGPNSGCFGGLGPEDEHCGTVEKTARYSQADPFADATAGQRKTSEVGEERVFAFSMGAEDACREQEVPYNITAHVAPAGDLDTCDPSPPRVWVSETAVGGSNKFNLTPTEEQGGLTYHRTEDLGLAQGKGDPQIWDVTLQIAFPKTLSRDNDVECAKKRIVFVEMSSDYWSLAEPGGTPTPSADTSNPCREVGVNGASQIQRGSSTKEANASDAGARRNYTWRIGAQDACRGEPVNFAMSMTVHKPSSNSACTNSPVTVDLKATTPGGTRDVTVPKTTTPDGDSRFETRGLLDLTASPTPLATWSMTLNLSIAATDHGPLDDACAKDLVAGISLEGAYSKPEG